MRTNLFLVALGLSLLGLVMIYSATYRDFGMYYLFTRIAHMVLALGAFVVTSRVRYPAWRKLAPWVYGAVLLSLLLVLIPGVGEMVGGSRRWFDFGFFSLQPAEFATLTAIIVLSCAVAQKRPGSGLPFGALAAVGLLLALVILEPDFSTSVMIVIGVAGVLWASEVSTAVLLLIGFAGFAGMVGVMFAEPYRRERFMTFLNPWAVSQGSGYQIVQSMIAIKDGGIFGVGVGGGTAQTVVPDASTDMIFSLIGQELGLLGMVVVIGAFCFLALAGLKIAMSAPSVMGRCMAAGLITVLVVQAIFNIGGTMGVLPLAGMTLPFISNGGTSLIACFAAIGILYRISEDSDRAREVKPRKPAGEKEKGDDRGRRYGRTRDSRAVRGG